MRAWDVLTVAAAVGAATSGGVFLAYSGFTTTALAKLPAGAAMAAMQQMNLAAPRSASFMTTLFAPAALSGLLAARAVIDREPAAGWVIAGAGVYIAGVALTTVTYHVPRNSALAALDPHRHADQWDSWLRSWVAGNHSRTISGIAAAALLAASLLRHPN